MNKKTLPSFVWIICNNSFVEKCEVLKETRDLITVKIISTGQGTRLRRSKIYISEEEANKALGRF